MNHRVAAEQGILVAMTTRVKIPDVNFTSVILRGYADQFCTDFDRKEVSIEGLRRVVHHNRIPNIPNGHGRFYTGQEQSNLLVMWVDPDDRTVMCVRAFENNFTQSDGEDVSIFTFQEDSLWCVRPIDLSFLANPYFPERENILVSDLVFRPNLRTAFSALRHAVPYN